MLSFGRVIVISNVERVVNGEVPLAHSALEINMRSTPIVYPVISLLHSTYLALGEGRFAVATASQISLPIFITAAHHANSGMGSM
jgi:hypothetical protein